MPHPFTSCPPNRGKAKSDTDPSYIGGVERGQRNPSFKKLCAIAKTIGRDVGSLTRNLPVPGESA